MPYTKLGTANPI